MPEERPFNPLDKENLGWSISDALAAQPQEQLSALTEFSGAGIYALMYTGPFNAYEGIAKKGAMGMYRIPIYVGKAIPEGGRKGGFTFDAAEGTKLFNRLSEHKDSIDQAENLSSADFYFKYLVTEDIWIPLGESLLIETFSPVWNIVVMGFGIHHPGGGRARQKCSMWDTLHPGRSFAQGRPPNVLTASEIEKKVREHLRAVLARLE